MDLNKLTMGDRVIAISGIVLLIFSFFDWLGLEASGPIEASATGNAWDFTLCLFAVLIGIAMVVLVAVKAFGAALPDLGGSASWGLILLVMGAVAFLFVLIKLIAGPNIPSELDGLPIDISKTREFGIFVGLVATAGLAVGGYLKLQEDKGASSASPPPAA